ncbi:glycoside hydrolase family 2 TIM barrel-domain containing protein [Asticcacaulis sp. ZE23SCel15]|uniref:glycoside hydrolase family 2 protein n=1 Tax=Asticcacaulis sp. ZE23SCel15 TaxID=3059027 RepID=UPI00265F665A|nr:glycoside hydrolase family 2 TIM barrel-domain containing protein [Asticcacaulis sp. ZE23SCel15]WKL57943.1 glycoside hydrolase family 2 TIM barrel-domain containing protein [Asticcacaulis sp. ZE23SCel15]
MNRRDLIKASVAVAALLPVASAWAQGTASPAAKSAIVLANASARTKLDLSGEWHVSIDPYRAGLVDAVGDPSKPRHWRYADVHVEDAEVKNPGTFFEQDMRRSDTVTLPGSWNAQRPEWRYYDGLMWYQRAFEAQAEAGKRAFLYFEASNYTTHVYLNGNKLGVHVGGFTPFAFEVTDVLRDGENRVTLGVDSEHDANAVPPVITDWDIYGGVTRPIRFITTPDTYVDDAFVRLGRDGIIRASVTLSGAAAATQKVVLTIKGLKALTATTDANGRAELSVKAPKSLKLWTPETPTLHEVRIEAAGDVFTDRIGFRTVEVKGEDILLNGKPIFLRGISHHEEEIGTNPARVITEDAARRLLTEIKTGLNGNYVRLSHYPHSEVTVRLCDEMGLLVWSEIPVYWAVNFGNPDTLKTAQTMLTENILRDRNRASVIIWSIANETPQTEVRNQFLRTLAKTARDLDETRLVSAALLVERKIVDGHIDMHIDDPLIPALDIMSVNTYNGWYGDDKLEALPATVWRADVKKPMIFSEFGADSKAGFHDPQLKRKFSEEYQADYYRYTLAMADKIPNLRGLSPWILKDFQAPRRQHPVYQQGWNRKGVISETGERKQAFNVLADFYKAKMK